MNAIENNRRRSGLTLSGSFPMRGTLGTLREHFCNNSRVGGHVQTVSRIDQRLRSLQTLSIVRVRLQLRCTAAGIDARRLHGLALPLAFDRGGFHSAGDETLFKRTGIPCAWIQGDLEPLGGSLSLSHISTKRTDGSSG
jgi:hypothetical protein